METVSKSNIIVSIFCICIVIFILSTQCSFSNIKLNVKDAAIILIFLALLAYINGYNIAFMILLATFVVLYFTPQKYFDKLLSPIIGKTPKSVLKQKEKEVYDNPQQQYEEMDERTYVTDNEITLDTEIELDDGFESVSGDENVEEVISKKK